MIDKNDIEQIADKILGKLQMHFDIEGGKADISASIGIAFGSKKTEMVVLIDSADTVI